MRWFFCAVGLFLANINYAQAQNYNTSLPLGFTEVNEDLKGLLAQGYRLVNSFSGGSGTVRASTFVLEKPNSVAVCVLPDADVAKAFQNIRMRCGVI